MMTEETHSLPRRRAENPDPIDIHVGSRLRLRRNLMGLSQDQLGKSSGLTFQQIQKYERGINRMGASRLYQMAKILEVAVSYFFEGAPQQGGEAPQMAAGFAETGQAALEDADQVDMKLLTRRETMELIRAYYRISDPKQRRKVYELVKSMAEIEGA